MDWTSIKTAYVEGQDSYRTLAAAYGLSVGAVSRVARQQGWVAARQAYRQQQAQSPMQGASQAVPPPPQNRLQRLLCLSDRLLDVVEQAVAGLQVNTILSEKTAIKTLAGTIKDIKSIQSVSTELDDEEQRARIAKLQQQVKEEPSDTDILIRVWGAEDLDG